MKAFTIKEYIVNELGKQPRHDLDCMADAISSVAHNYSIDHEELMRLLLGNEPTSDGMSHSYGFHTRYGRCLINETISKYYEYESNY